MATEKTGPESEKIQKAAEAAKQEILSKSVLDALMTATEDHLVGATDETEVIKGTAKESGGWLHGPGTLDLFRAADKRLATASKWAGMPVKQVERVHAWVIKGTKILVIKAAAPDDKTAYPVTRRGYNTYINLVTLLSETNLTVASGWRERFEAAYIPKGSPLWPGLVIDLGDVKERRQEPAKKSVQATAQVAAAKQPPETTPKA